MGHKVRGEVWGPFLRNLTVYMQIFQNPKEDPEINTQGSNAQIRAIQPAGAQSHEVSSGFLRAQRRKWTFQSISPDVFMQRMGETPASSVFILPLSVIQQGDPRPPRHTQRTFFPQEPIARTRLDIA